MLATLSFSFGEGMIESYHDLSKIAFPLQQRLQDRASMYRFTYSTLQPVWL